MTRTLSEDLNFCYTLLFTGERALKSSCYLKALLCFEDCRKSAEKLLKVDSVYLYCFFRALRKESQVLRHLGLNKRSYRVLKSSVLKVDAEWHSTDKLLALLQLFDLSEQFEPGRRAEFFKMLNLESNALREE